MANLKYCSIVEQTIIQARLPLTSENIHAHFGNLLCGNIAGDKAGFGLGLQPALCRVCAMMFSEHQWLWAQCCQVGTPNAQPLPRRAPAASPGSTGQPTVSPPLHLVHPHGPRGEVWCGVCQGRGCVPTSGVRTKRNPSTGGVSMQAVVRSCRGSEFARGLGKIPHL
jgi:hypothetical protein